ncbi:MAG: EamA family transporter [Anaerolineae bacterium]
MLIKDAFTVIGVLWSLAMAAMFGFSQLTSRKGLTGIAVDQGTFIMIVVSTTLLAVPFFWLGGPELVQQADATSLAYFLMAGLIHFVGGTTLMNISISTIGAARTGSLIATTPLFATFLAALSLKELINAPLIGGVTIVILGVLLISSRSAKMDKVRVEQIAKNPTDIRQLGISRVAGSRSEGYVGGGRDRVVSLARESVFGLLAALSWGFTPVLIKKGLMSLPSPLAGLTLAMASAGVVYAVILAIRGRLRPLTANLRRGPVLWQMASGALVGLGTLCRWIALSFTTAAMVTTLSRASLLITVGLGSKLLGRDLEPTTNRVRWGALCIVLGSIVVVLFGRP